MSNLSISQNLYKFFNNYFAKFFIDFIFDCYLPNNYKPIN